MGISNAARMSRSLRPAAGRSTVRTIASKPAICGRFDERLGEAAVARPVELEPLPPAGRRFGELGCGRAPESREAHDRSGLRSAPRHGEVAVRMGEVLERRRRDEDGHRDLTTEDSRRRGDRGHVDEHARPQVPAPERREVLGERALVARAAHEVTPRAGLDLALGEALEVPGVERLGHAADRKAFLRAARPRLRHAKSAAGKDAGSPRMDIRGRPRTLAAAALQQPEVLALAGRRGATRGGASRGRPERAAGTRRRRRGRTATRRRPRAPCRRPRRASRGGTAGRSSSHGRRRRRR